MAASPTRLIVSVAHAGLKAISSRLRGIGGKADYEHWPVRAGACERCPMRVTKCGKSYCGQPFLRRPIRDPAVDGCGCPTHAKAKDPAEHCPVNAAYTASGISADGACDCKWCGLTKRLAVRAVAA